MRAPYLSLPASRIVAFAFVGLLMVNLHIDRASARGLSNRSGSVIHVWVIGSPFTGVLPQMAIPPTLEHQAESFGYTLDVKSLQAAGFAASFRQAVLDHNEPELLTFDNFGVVWGVNTRTGWVDGIASDYQIASSLVMVHESFSSLQPRGWVLLVRTAANYEAARSLAMQPPVCGAGVAPVAKSSMPLELRQAQDSAISAARAYLACDRASLASISDESRLGGSCFLPEHDTQVEDLEVCSVSGNQNLAFVSLAGAFMAQAHPPAYSPRNYPGLMPSLDLGHQTILAVLRKQGSAWRLLSISDDPTDTDRETRLKTERLAGLLDSASISAAPPQPAHLNIPDGAFLRPPPGQRFADFIWGRSASDDVVSEVAEFLVRDSSTTRERTRLFFMFGHEERLSSGFLWGRAGRWRVWSIDKSGNMALSEQRDYITH